MAANPLATKLKRLGACPEAVAWVLDAGHTDVRSAWAVCERADWMLWYYAKQGGDRKQLVLAACACAETALPIYEGKYPEDKRPRVAIETARRWAEGKATIEEVRAAAAAAYAASYDAAAAAAAYAAYAASYAADAADAADAAAYAYAASANRKKALASMAKRVRKIIPAPTKEQT